MPKLLAEFLQEQQEPFALEVYLLERGYSRGTSLDASSSFRNSAQFLTGSASCGLRSRRHALPNCSEFVKAVFSRLLLQYNQKIKNPENGGRKCTLPDDRESRQEHADGDKFSSASGTTVFNSCSENDVEDAHCLEEEEADADRKLKWRSMEDSNKQLSPVSVLEETESDDKQYNFKTTQGESSTSISQCKPKQPTHYSVQELQELVGSNSYAQYIINKRALQQTKQLLIDCVREVIEIHRKRDHKGRQQVKKILGAEELWKLVCENVWLWSQDSIDETNIVHLLNYDVMASAEEWRTDSEQQKEEISMEIGDAILEGIINEIVAS
ncbi:hypothetical protein Pfo_021901 [Paulownia fortunei]|nr:hypothetical protein Pfo_021901 [Paulownia fortunei]